MKKEGKFKRKLRTPVYDIRPPTNLQSPWSRHRSQDCQLLNRFPLMINSQLATENSVTSGVTFTTANSANAGTSKTQMVRTQTELLLASMAVSGPVRLLTSVGFHEWRTSLLPLGFYTSRIGGKRWEWV